MVQLEKMGRMVILIVEYIRYTYINHIKPA